MPTNAWLELLLEKMQRDLDEIKADVKTLQKAKFKFDGAMIVICSLVSGCTTAIVLYFKG